MNRCLQIFALSLTLFFGMSAMAQEDSLFNQATEAYNQGRYDEAISNYQKILESGKHSAAVYFNLGNSYYKKNEIAPSIYYYEKALLLKPEDPEIQNNLRFARNMTLDAISPLPQTDLQRYYERLVFALSMDGWAYAGIFFVLFFVGTYLFFLGSNTPNRKRIGLITSLGSLILAVVCTALSYLQYRAYQKDQPAIIFASEIPVRSEPNERSTSAFLLHEGTRVQVLDSLDRWRKIELADGQNGWLPAESMRLLKDF
ncbi:MAG: tetratricopeptide repeat protein [Robiginitalea sp.]|jgi:tetratricopeptide (TPR) repeat protein